MNLIPINLNELSVVQFTFVITVFLLIFMLRMSARERKDANTTIDKLSTAITGFTIGEAEQRVEVRTKGDADAKMMEALAESNRRLAIIAEKLVEQVNNVQKGQAIDKTNREIDKKDIANMFRSVEGLVTKLSEMQESMLNTLITKMDTHRREDKLEASVTMQKVLDAHSKQPQILNSPIIQFAIPPTGENEDGIT